MLVGFGQGWGRQGWREKGSSTKPLIVFPPPPESSHPRVTLGILDMADMVLKTWQTQSCIPSTHPSLRFSFYVYTKVPPTSLPFVSSTSLY